jgi:hypothetical protein
MGSNFVAYHLYIKWEPCNSYLQKWGEVVVGESPEHQKSTFSSMGKNADHIRG